MCASACVRVRVLLLLWVLFLKKKHFLGMEREKEPWAGRLGPEPPGRPGSPTWPHLGGTACSPQVPPMENAQVLAADLQSVSKLERSSNRLVKDHVLGMLRSSLGLGCLDICVLQGSHLLHPHALGVIPVPVGPSAPSPLACQWLPI